MNLEKRVKEQLLIRGFSNELQLNNRGLIGATIDETTLDLVKNLTIPVVNGMLPLSDYAKEKLEYINGHWMVREFPKLENIDLQWIGAVLDLLEELKLGNYR